MTDLPENAPPLRLEFTYSIDDCKEAQAAHGRIARGFGVMGLRGWLIIVLVFMGGSLLAISFGGGRSGTAQPSSVDTALRVLLPLVPWLLLFGGLWIIIARATRHARPMVPQGLYIDPHARGCRAMGWILGIVATVLVLLRLLSSPRRDPASAAVTTAPAPPPVSAGDVLLPLIPWIVIFGFIWLVFFRAMRRSTARGWEGQPWLHRPHIVNVGPRGVTDDSGVTRMEHAWAAFPRFIETPNLFVLYVSDFSFLMLPKRALGGASDAILRDMLHANIHAPTAAEVFADVIPHDASADKQRDRPAL